jgi:hypothetical protein
MKFDEFLTEHGLVDESGELEEAYQAGWDDAEEYFAKGGSFK